MNGEIKIFDKKRGFGFIKDNYNNEYFIHITNIEKQAYLAPGDKVEFQPAKNKKGLYAINCKKVV